MPVELFYLFNTGLGVFAQRDFRSKEILLEYAGKLDSFDFFFF